MTFSNCADIVQTLQTSKFGELTVTLPYHYFSFLSLAIAYNFELYGITFLRHDID